jgi:vesicle-associated membrane protein 2
MADSNASGGPTTGPDGRPLGPDGKPLPGPQQMQQVMAQRRMAQQQAQVDEVVGIMKNNVEKVLDRDAKLSELDERADALQDGASQFEKQAGKLKNKFWMQNMKFLIAGAIVGLILLILLYFKFSDDNHQQQMMYAPPPNQAYVPPPHSGNGGGGEEAPSAPETK